MLLSLRNRLQFILELGHVQINMKVLVIISAFLAASVMAGSIPSDWTSFKLKYNKKYKDAAEDSEREAIFKANKEAIEKHNKLFDQGKVSYSKALNEFSDMTKSEVDRFNNGYKINDREEVQRKRSSIVVSGNLPTEVDWRAKGAVTQVWKQSGCGSCYAFSAVGAIEGQYFIKTGKLLPLSVQQIVDCSDPSDDGCDG
jgi:C1A family cysteine protease